MKLVVSKNATDLGKAAGSYAAEKIQEAIKQNGVARIILSTGASQFETMETLVRADIDWSKVEMFHLDEYIDISIEHPASFRKYLNERFINIVNPKHAYLVDGNNPEKSIASLTDEIEKAPIDVALIGIGENAHIAFNDPPADFDTKEAYIIVDLDKKCRMQQVGEGWFKTIDDVPVKAITMTPYRIMQSKCIVSAVPHSVKANAVYNVIVNEKTNMIPATLLKEHQDISLFVDENSASLLTPELIEKYK
jgi:glucosamine-6-phosphate deaminase